MKKQNIFRSFYCAFRGLNWIVIKERNYRIHLFMCSVVIAFGIIFNLSFIQWLLIILVIALVLEAEIFNTVTERVCDLLRDKLNLDYSETTVIRDIAAGAVLLAVLFAVVVGVVIFGGKLLEYINLSNK